MLCFLFVCGCLFFVLLAGWLGFFSPQNFFLPHQWTLCLLATTMTDGICKCSHLNCHEVGGIYKGEASCNFLIFISTEKGILFKVHKTLLRPMNPILVKWLLELLLWSNFWERDWSVLSKLVFEMFLLFLCCIWQESVFYFHYDVNMWFLRNRPKL